MRAFVASTKVPKYHREVPKHMQISRPVKTNRLEAAGDKGKSVQARELIFPAPIAKADRLTYATDLDMVEIGIGNGTGASLSANCHAPRRAAPPFKPCHTAYMQSNRQSQRRVSGARFGAAKHPRLPQLLRLRRNRTPHFNDKCCPVSSNSGGLTLEKILVQIKNQLFL